MKEEFSLAFRCFGSLECVWAGTWFGFYGQSLASGPEDILPNILARSAPRLSLLIIGPESNGRAVTAPRCFRPERGKDGAVFGLMKLDSNNVPLETVPNGPFHPPEYARICRLTSTVRVTSQEP